MLILMRRRQESVVIGGSSGFEPVLKVTVLDITASRVRLGFEVAADVPVHRLEVWERICADEQANRSLELFTPPKQELQRWEDEGGSQG